MSAPLGAQHWSGMAVQVNDAVLSIGAVLLLISMSISPFAELHN